MHLTHIILHFVFAENKNVYYGSHGFYLTINTIFHSAISGLGRILVKQVDKHVSFYPCHAPCDKVISPSAPGVQHAACPSQVPACPHCPTPSCQALAAPLASLSAVWSYHLNTQPITSSASSWYMYNYKWCECTKHAAVLQFHTHDLSYRHILHLCYWC